MSVAEGFAGFENVMLPGEPPEHLRLVPKWQPDLGTWPEVEQSRHFDLPAARSAEHRAAVVALHEVLCEWRAVARELDLIPPHSLDRAVLVAQADALRAVHHRLFVQLNRD